MDAVSAISSKIKVTAVEESRCICNLARSLVSGYACQ